MCMHGTTTYLAMVKGVAADDVTKVLDVAVVAMVVMLVDAVERSSPDVVDALAETNMVAAAGMGATLFVEEGVVLTAAEEVGTASTIPVAGVGSTVVAMTTGATWLAGWDGATAAAAEVDTEWITCVGVTWAVGAMAV